MNVVWFSVGFSQMVFRANVDMISPNTGVANELSNELSLLLVNYYRKFVGSGDWLFVIVTINYYVVVSASHEMRKSNVYEHITCSENELRFPSGFSFNSCYIS